MRTTLELDDALVARAKLLTGYDDITTVVHEALRALIERESARRLARMGGTEPRWDCRHGDHLNRLQLTN